MDQLVLPHAVHFFLHTFIDTLEMTINTILERIWKTKCDLFRLRFAASLWLCRFNLTVQGRSFSLSGCSIHPTIQAL